MNRRKHYQQALALLLICFGVATQEVAAQDSLRMDLNQVIEFALSESPTYKVANQEITRKQYTRKEQVAALIPAINGSAAYQRTLKKQVMVMAFGGQEQRIEVGMDNTWNMGFDLVMPVINVALWKGIQLTEQDIELTVEKARSSKIEMINQLQKSYYTYLLSKDSRDVINATFRSTKANADNIAKKYATGNVSEYEKLRSEVTVKNLMPQVVSAANSVLLSEMQLKVLMGADVDVPIVFTGSLADFEAQVLDQLVAAPDLNNLSGNTDLKQMDLQIAQLETARKAALAQYYPTLSLAANYSWLELTNNFDFANYRWSPTSTIGISLAVPIFDGGKKHYKNQQDKISISNLKLQKDALRRSIQLDVQNSFNKIQSTNANVIATRQSIEEATKAYRISLKRYELGSATLLELNDTELALTNARLSYNQALYDYLTSLSDLNKSLGVEVDKY